MTGTASDDLDVLNTALRAAQTAINHLTNHHPDTVHNPSVATVTRARQLTAAAGRIVDEAEHAFRQAHGFSLPPQALASARRTAPPLAHRDPGVARHHPPQTEGP